MEIGGYKIHGDFMMAGGGTSTWAFGKKRGKEYFVKRFLAPKYPFPGAPGSATTLARKRADCEAFEARRRSIMDALAPRCGSGGNLVAPIELFRSGAFYYAVSEKVDVADGMQPDRIAALPVEQRLFVMQTVAYSLRILHDSRIVHGDLKPPNILIKKSVKGSYVAKIIDIDDSYFAGAPPQPENIVGDPVFYSPELGEYVTGRGGVDGCVLQTSSDMFGLGVVYSLYLSGRRPAFDSSTYQYPWQAAHDGVALRVECPDAPLAVLNCVAGMLERDPRSRPDVGEVFELLRRGGVALPSAVTHGATSATRSDHAAAPPVGLRGTLASGSRAVPLAPGLRGSMVRRIG